MNRTETGVHREICRRVSAMEPGTVMAICDFRDVASPKTVSKILSRLCDAGTVEKLARGIYWLPYGFEHGNGGGGMPYPDLVAKALARSNSWRAAPCGDTALHIAGMKSIAPTIWTYVTDGTYREYIFGNYIIRFNHTTGKLISEMSDKAALLVQVLRAYGKDHISAELLSRLASFIKPEESGLIIEETKNTIVWISEAINKMLGKKPATGNNLTVDNR